jgi:hypothetical protein
VNWSTREAQSLQLSVRVTLLAELAEIGDRVFVYRADSRPTGNSGSRYIIEDIFREDDSMGYPGMLSLRSGILRNLERLIPQNQFSDSPKWLLFPYASEWKQTCCIV